MYGDIGVTPPLGTTVECCHSEDVSLIHIIRIIKTGDCHVAPCTIQTISDVPNEIINHLAAGSFHPSHKEPWLNTRKGNRGDVRG